MKAIYSCSIKRNFIYKSVLTISTYLINFLVFPYISRVLGVEKVGLVGFVDNTINYFFIVCHNGGRRYLGYERLQ